MQRTVYAHNKGSEGARKALSQSRMKMNVY